MVGRAAILMLFFYSQKFLEQKVTLQFSQRDFAPL